MNNDDKTYKIYISDTEFEVSEEEYKEHHKIMEHSKYLRKEERKVTILSYEGLMEELNVDGIVADESVNVEERAITNVMIDELRKILKTLSKDELDLIDKIIYEEKSEREVADKYGISHTAVGKRWDKLCEKLRKLLERRQIATEKPCFTGLFLMQKNFFVLFLNFWFPLGKKIPLKNQRGKFLKVKLPSKRVNPEFCVNSLQDLRNDV